MDCFLIAHCIWNEPTQSATVLQFTKDAVQKHGYKLEIDLKDLKEELSDFDMEVKNYCNYNREETIETPKVFHSEFYNIVGLKKPLIKVSDFNNLNEEYVQIPLCSDTSQSYQRQNSFEDHSIKASTKPNHIVLDDEHHKIEIDEKIEIVPYTRKPTTSLKTYWDKRIKVLLTKFSNLKSQIEGYRSNDLKHVRVNLFVNPALAEIVETNLNDTQKEIEKLEVEANRIQYYYENIEDQSKPQEIKQLPSGNHNE
jgi:MoxR-like ATPase